MKKPTTYELRLIESDTVEAYLVRNGRKVMHFRDPKGKPARIRFPVPDKATLREQLSFHAAHDSTQPTLASQARFYTRCIDDDIGRQMIEIRRAFRRILKCIQCVRIAEELIKENAEPPPADILARLEIMRGGVGRRR